MQASFNVADFERVALRLRPRLVSAASVWLGSGVAPMPMMPCRTQCSSYGFSATG